MHGEPAGNPRGRAVPVADLAIAPRLPEPIAGTESADASRTPVDDALASGPNLVIPLDPFDASTSG
jgi:8-oxo-dGTP diphosphatase